MHHHHIECVFPAGQPAVQTFRLTKRSGAHSHWSVRVISGNVPADRTLRFQGTTLIHGNGSDLIAVGGDATEAVGINYASGPMTLRLCDLAGATQTPSADVVVLVELIES